MNAELDVLQQSTGLREASVMLSLLRLVLLNILAESAVGRSLRESDTENEPFTRTHARRALYG